MGKNVKIGVASTEALSSLSYSIFGRGKLVFAETLEGSRTVYNELNFRANSDMSPRCRVIVYYARCSFIHDVRPSCAHIQATSFASIMSAFELIHGDLSMANPFPSADVICE